MYKFLPTLIYEGILRIYLGKKVFFSRKEKTFKENDIKDEISSEIALKKKDKVFYILHEWKLKFENTAVINIKILKKWLISLKNLEKILKLV